MIRIVALTNGKTELQGTNEELDRIREGGTFHVEINGKLVTMSCDPGYTNVRFEREKS